MKKTKKKIIWFCGLPENARIEAFADLGLPSGASWSWVAGHMPPPDHIDLHVVCASRHLKENITRSWCGATIHLIKVPRGGSFFMYEGWIPAFVKKARELQPDMVHGWGTENAFGLAALRAAPRTHLIGIQGILSVTWPVMRKTLLMFLCVINERRVLRRAQYCVAESYYSKRTASFFTSAEVQVVPHPLRNEFLEASLGSRNKKIMVYLGVLAHRKGVFDAIKAFLLIESDWTLVCIGSVGNSQDRAELDILLENESGGNRVKLVGFQSCSEIIGWFQRSPLFFLPSFTDTGPTALKEALSMGLWPVCYDNTGPKELIERYQVGSLVTTGDIDALARELKRLLEEKPWNNNDLMEQVSHRIKEDLSPDVVWKKLDTVYDEIRVASV